MEHVNLGMTALRTNHHKYHEYVGMVDQASKEYHMTMQEDVEFLILMMKEHVGTDWREVCKPCTFNKFSARGMDQKKTAVSKLKNAYAGLPAWLAHLDDSNIIFEEADICTVFEASGAEVDHLEDLIPDATVEQQDQVPSQKTAVSKWVATHPTSGGEAEEAQAAQATTLMTRSAHRQEKLWSKRVAEEQKIAEQVEAEAIQTALKAAKAAEKEFVVEAIVNKRVLDGKCEYRVKWYNWDAKHNTWEDEGNLQNCRNLIAKYEKTKKTKK
jgi:hypothetical protein